MSCLEEHFFHKIPNMIKCFVKMKAKHYIINNYIFERKHFLSKIEGGALIRDGALFRGNTVEFFMDFKEHDCSPSVTWTAGQIHILPLDIFDGWQYRQITFQAYHKSFNNQSLSFLSAKKIFHCKKALL